MPARKPVQRELPERVIVTLRSGERSGLIRERWHGPITGDSYVVDLDGGGMVIAPVATVRRPSESEAL